MKRKRKDRSGDSSRPSKKRKSRRRDEEQTAKPIDHPVLSRYYAKVLTLREYLLLCLPKSSKRRKRLIGLLGKVENKKLGRGILPSTTSQPKYLEAITLLDSVLVGSNEACVPRSAKDDDRDSKDFETFSQQLIATGSVGARSQLGGHGVQLSEIVDFAIWLLFNKKHAAAHKPPHILCHGALRASSTWATGGGDVSCGIPGLVRVSANEHVAKLKSSAWTSVFELLGKGGDRIMLDLLLGCGLYVPMDASAGTFYQLSGHSLSELQPLKDSGSANFPEVDNSKASILRSSSDIRFVRSRMLYARAALNAKRDVAFGLRHIHVLNRYPDPANASHTAHIMKYVFPRQFGLHNVFTSKTDPKETSQPFHDYTLREKEIARSEMSRKVKGLRQSTSEIAINIPKRLRGKTFHWMRRLQTRHARCSYTKLLAHYCPLPDSLHSSQSGKSPNLPAGEQHDCMSLATPAAQVSAYVRAVISNVFPHQLFGKDECNRKLLHRQIDIFIKARRFESLTLEAVVHGMKIGAVDWLRPPRLDTDQKMSLSDFQKRQEIFAELIYYMFDSFIIALIRTNFHVTESGAHRNRLFYFRHDVWRRMTEPALTTLKTTLFDEIGGERAFKSLEKRTLGFSQIRLLPKESGMRPISNLRRRVQTLQNGRNMLGRSINSMLAPAFSVLNYEKQNQATRLGASLFSIGGIYEKLQTYRQKLADRGQLGQRLYFVKVDVKGCFDSIPQKRMMQLVEQLVSAYDYRISRHAAIMPAEFQGNSVAKPTRKFAAEVQVGTGAKSFTDLLGQPQKLKRHNSIYVDSVVPQHMSKKQIVQLLHEHVGNNVVKIGKKFYRQKHGIPQGSVVSSLLCNFFYGDLELNHLGFLSSEHSVLFRLIDDFLLVTTHEAQARQFLEAMHGGIPSYGVSVKPEKSLANFAVHVGGEAVRQVSNTNKFPYCGVLINTQSLDISKDNESSKRGGVRDSLTVEYSKRPGQNFRRKTLSALKIQMHTMLLDTSHNSKSTVMANVYHSMVEVAAKAFQYIQALERRQRPSLATLTGTVEELAGLAFAMQRSQRNKQRSPSYKCCLSRVVTQWITAKAFLAVFGRKQTKFQDFLARLRGQHYELQGSCRHESKLLAKMIAGQH